MDKIKTVCFEPLFEIVRVGERFAAMTTTSPLFFLEADTAGEAAEKGIRALQFHAQAIETGTVKTEGLGPKDESAVEDAPNPNGDRLRGRG